MSQKEEETRTQSILVVVGVDRALHSPVAIDRAARLRVAQDAGVVDERLGPLVRREVELDQDALDVEQVPLERVQEAARLQVLRRRAPVVAA